MSDQLPDGFVDLIGHQPANATLFVEALTHGSHNIHGASADYQRLEFLGDRVLGLVVAEALYTRFPREGEGRLSARLNALVARATCADVARDLGLAPMVRLGRQARDDGGRDSDNILGDVVEALIGALFVDAGLDAAQRFVLASWGGRIDALAEAPKHPKAALLEWAAKHKRKPPLYEILRRDGPDHAPVFTIRVEVPRVGEAQGSGSSRQEAETAAASALLAQVAHVAQGNRS